MSDAGAVSGRGKGRKVLLQLVLGGVCGAAGMAASLWLLEGLSGADVEPARALAIGTALVFGLTALFVSLGVIAPGLGARTLNVEDREELEEQRSALLVGAVSFFLVALLLGALTLGGSEGDPGLFGSWGTALVAAGAVLALIAWSIIHRDKGDEMMRAAAKDAGAITAHLLFLIFGLWAGAAHFGIVPMFDPLLFVAGYFALYLVAVFVAVGRRGLLAPR
jgi:ABC-type nickel/cobalt efflux system permease component RcnA